MYFWKPAVPIQYSFRYRQYPCSVYFQIPAIPVPCHVGPPWWFPCEGDAWGIPPSCLRFTTPITEWPYASPPTLQPCNRSTEITLNLLCWRTTIRLKTDSWSFEQAIRKSQCQAGYTLRVHLFTALIVFYEHSLLLYSSSLRIMFEELKCGSETKYTFISIKNIMK